MTSRTASVNCLKRIFGSHHREQGAKRRKVARVQRAEERAPPRELQKIAENLPQSSADQGICIRQLHESGKRTT